MTAIEPKAEWSTYSKPINSKEWKRGKKKKQKGKKLTQEREPGQKNVTVVRSLLLFLLFHSNSE